MSFESAAHLNIQFLQFRVLIAIMISCFILSWISWELILLFLWCISLVLLLRAKARLILITTKSSPILRRESIWPALFVPIRSIQTIKNPKSCADGSILTVLSVCLLYRGLGLFGVPSAGLRFMRKIFLSIGLFWLFASIFQPSERISKRKWRTMSG